MCVFIEVVQTRTICKTKLLRTISDTIARRQLESKTSMKLISREYENFIIKQILKKRLNRALFYYVLLEMT